MKKFFLLCSDAIVLYVSLVLTLFIRYGERLNYQYQLHILPFSLIFILWLLIFYIANLYDIKSLRNNIDFYSSLLKTILVAAGVSALFFYLIPIYGITPRKNLLIFILFVGGFEIINRSIFNNILAKSFKKPVLIVGTNEQALELGKFIKENPQLGYSLKYIVDPTLEILDRAGGDLKKFGIIRDIKNMDRVIKTHRINTIILSPEAYQVTEVIDIFYKSLGQKINFYNLSSFYERLTGQVPLGNINQIWFLENLSEGSKKIYEFLKRIGDIVFAIILGIISIIFYPFIILAIKLTSNGPTFYKQARVGQAGKIFKIIKFRTMTKDAEDKTGAVWASENDPRITAVGKFLRKTRVDELPQLWNILKGEMSFVGPRAERPEFQDILKSVPFYEERYLIKPGLTGWAQINFRYGSSIKDAAEKLKFDLYYIKNRSLILDIGIILKTIRIALKQAGK